MCLLKPFVALKHVIAQGPCLNSKAMRVGAATYLISRLPQFFVAKIVKIKTSKFCLSHNL